MYRVNCFLTCINVLAANKLTFPLKALLAEEADHGQKLSDLLQVHDGSVVQVDDGHRILIIR